MFGFAATLFTLFLAVALVAALSFFREPSLHWFNWSASGGIRLAAFALIPGAMIALAMYIIVIPLVLLWPTKSQLKHWYAFLCVAALLPIALFGRPWRQPGITSHNVFAAFTPHAVFALLAFPVLPILGGGACYLLLLRRQQSRLNPPSTP